MHMACHMKFQSLYNKPEAIGKLNTHISRKISSCRKYCNYRARHISILVSVFGWVGVTNQLTNLPWCNCNITKTRQKPARIPLNLTREWRGSYLIHHPSITKMNWKLFFSRTYLKFLWFELNFLSILKNNLNFSSLPHTPYSNSMLLQYLASAGKAATLQNINFW